MEPIPSKTKSETEENEAEDYAPVSSPPTTPPPLAPSSRHPLLLDASWIVVDENGLQLHNGTASRPPTASPMSLPSATPQLHHSPRTPKGAKTAGNSDVREALERAERTLSALPVASPPTLIVPNVVGMGSSALVPPDGTSKSLQNATATAATTTATTTTTMPSSSSSSTVSSRSSAFEEEDDDQAEEEEEKRDEGDLRPNLVPSLNTTTSTYYSGDRGVALRGAENQEEEEEEEEYRQFPGSLDEVMEGEGGNDDEDEKTTRSSPSSSTSSSADFKVRRFVSDDALGTRDQQGRSRTITSITTSSFLSMEEEHVAFARLRDASVEVRREEESPPRAASFSPPPPPPPPHDQQPPGDEARQRQIVATSSSPPPASFLSAEWISRSLLKIAATFGLRGETIGDVKILPFLISHLITFVVGYYVGKKIGGGMEPMSGVSNNGGTTFHGNGGGGGSSSHNTTTTDLFLQALQQQHVAGLYQQQIAHHHTSYLYGVSSSSSSSTPTSSEHLGLMHILWSPYDAAGVVLQMQERVA